MRGRRDAHNIDWWCFTFYISHRFNSIAHKIFTLQTVAIFYRLIFHLNATQRLVNTTINKDFFVWQQLFSFLNFIQFLFHRLSWSQWTILAVRQKIWAVWIKNKGDNDTIWRWMSHQCLQSEFILCDEFSMNDSHWCNVTK